MQPYSGGVPLVTDLGGQSAAVGTAGTVWTAPSGAYGLVVWGGASYTLQIAKVGAAMGGTARLAGTAAYPFASPNLGSVAIGVAAATQVELTWLINKR